MTENTYTIQQASDIYDIYKEGGFDIEVEAYMLQQGFDINSFQRLYSENPSFRSIIDKGRVYAQAFWAGKLRAGAESRTFNLPVWFAAAKAQGMINHIEPPKNDGKDEADKELIEEIQKRYVKKLTRQLQDIDKGLNGTTLATIM